MMKNLRLQKKISAWQIVFKLLCSVSFLLAVFVFLYPLFTVAVKCIAETGSGYNVAAAESTASGGQAKLLRVACFTVYQAFLSALCATCFGLILSYFCAKKDFALRKFLLSLAAVPVAVPPLIMALSYVLFFGKAGILNSFRFLFSPEAKIHGSNFLYSFFAVILIHSFYNFPIALKTITNVWENEDSDLEHAAALLSNSKPRIFFKIILPELFPALLSSFLLIFIYCFFSFLIILLFGGLGLSTLEVELYQVSRFSLHLIDSVKIALTEMLIAFFFVLLYIVSKLKNYKNAVESPTIKMRTKMNRTEKIIYAICLVLCFFFLVFPICSILLKSIFSFQVQQTNADFFTRLKSFFTLDLSSWRILCSASTVRAIVNTIIVGVMTASFSVLCALWINYREFKSTLKDRERFLLKALPFVPLVISPVVFGFALRTSFSLQGKYASNFLLLSLAQSCTAWTIAYTQINASFLQIPKSVMQASILLSNNAFDAFCRTILPLLKTGIASGFAFCFAISAGDASLPLMLRIPQFQNLSLMILRLSGAYRFSESSVLAFVLIIIVILNFLLTSKNTKKENL